VATAALTIAIFVVDLLTPVTVAVPGLYVAVVLLAPRFSPPRGVVLIAAGCVALTIVGYLLSGASGVQSEEGAINAFVSIAAVAVTAGLALEGQASEARLRDQASLLDLTHDTVFVRGMDDVITFWNRGAAELYGWSTGEAVGQASHKLMQTRFPTPLAEINAELLRSGRWEGELIHIKRDGTQVTVSSRWSLVRDSQGKPATILETNNDITERTRAEATLREQASLLDLTHDTIFVRGMDDVITSWNRGAEELYGWSSTEAVGQVSHELTRTIFPAPLKEINAELLRTGRWEGELVHTKRDGTRVTVSSRWSLQRDCQGRPAIILETNNDITERRQAEYLTGHVFESSPDGMCIIGRDYRYQRVNPVYARLLDMPAESVTGKLVADVIDAELFEERTRPSLERSFAGEDVSEAAWIPSRGGRLYLGISISPLRRSSERVEAVLVIVRDLTELALASEALRAAQADLAHVNRVATMGQLTASIAHEVNQPIAAAIINAQAAMRWLGTQPPNLDEVSQAIGRVIDSGRRAGDVIGRIRAIVAKAPPRKTRFDLNEAVNDVVALTRNEAVKHGVSMQTRLATDLPSVEGDRVQLQQVVLNLIMNAIEAMSGVEDGPRELRVSTEMDAACGVRVAVRDSGPGLDPLNEARLFDAFYTTKPEGMGMGLAICRSIVEEHGGRLWASANDPRGAVFQLTLPADQAEADPVPQAGQM
jgi:PAS domain S-box-containing protein